MSQAYKRRTIYQLPICERFTAEYATETVCLTLDELEAIRLMDYVGLDQEGCASRMHVARSTAQNIIHSAHEKIADALVNGKTVEIGGGNIELSEDANLGYATRSIETIPHVAGLKDWNGIQNMRIVVCAEKDNDNIFEHFGMTPFFKVYDVENSKVQNIKMVPTDRHGHTALVKTLSDLRADVLICGYIGIRARKALTEKDVTVYSGCRNNCDEAVSAFMEGHLTWREFVS